MEQNESPNDGHVFVVVNTRNEEELSWSPIAVFDTNDKAQAHVLACKGYDDQHGESFLYGVEPVLLNPKVSFR